jgi:hypothetical protein
MSLRQSIINDRLEELVTSSGDEPDMAFMKFVYATINYGEYEDLQPEDVVDGGQDKVKLSRAVPRPAGLQNRT